MKNVQLVNFFLTVIRIIVDNGYSRAYKNIKVVHKIKNFLIIAIPIAIVVIVIFAIIHTIYTIKTYNSILTALPLSTSVAIELAFWFVLVLIGIIVYFLIKK